jgi:hypothetical protein
MCDSPISGLVECQNRANSSDDLQRLACPDVACRVLVSGSPADKDQESRCYEPPIRIPAPLWADSQPDSTGLGNRRTGKHVPVLSGTQVSIRNALLLTASPWRFRGARVSSAARP